MNAYLYVACCYLLLQLGGSEVQIICRREGVTERWRGGVLSGRGGESRREQERESERAAVVAILCWACREWCAWQCAIPVKSHNVYASSPELERGRERERDSWLFNHAPSRGTSFGIPPVRVAQHHWVLGCDWLSWMMMQSAGDGSGSSQLRWPSQLVLASSHILSKAWRQGKDEQGRLQNPTGSVFMYFRRLEAEWFTRQVPAWQLVDVHAHMKTNKSQKNV